MEQIRTWIRAGVSLLGGLANAVLGTILLAPLLYGVYLQVDWIPHIAGLSKSGPIYGKSGGPAWSWRTLPVQPEDASTLLRFGRS